jgi:hypothetical protein
MSRFRQLVAKTLANDDFAQRIRKPETREAALKEFGLKDDELTKALGALKKVDMKAVEGFRDSLDGPVEIPI